MGNYRPGYAWDAGDEPWTEADETALQAERRRMYSHIFELQSATWAKHFSRYSQTGPQTEADQPCSSCRGDGVVRDGYEFGEMHIVTCPRCRGTGIKN